MTTGKILDKVLFLNLLDREVNRGIRYQNYFSLLKLNLTPLPGNEEGNGLKTCSRNLSNLLTEELRNTDMVGFLADNQLAVLIPYADSSAGGLCKSRLLGSLKDYDDLRKGYSLLIDLICFPTDGTSTAALMGKLLSPEQLGFSEKGFFRINPAYTFKDGNS
jgi:hypothetical protein